MSVFLLFNHFSENNDATVINILGNFAILEKITHLLRKKFTEGALILFFPENN